MAMAVMAAAPCLSRPDRSQWTQPVSVQTPQPSRLPLIAELTLRCSRGDSGSLAPTGEECRPAVRCNPALAAGLLTPSRPPWSRADSVRQAALRGQSQASPHRFVLLVAQLATG